MVCNMSKSRITIISCLCFIITVSCFGQNISRFLLIPAHGPSSFAKYKLQNKGIAGSQLGLKYETKPLRNTLRRINRNFKELYITEQRQNNSFELDISKATILQEKLLREAENNLLASNTKVATMPTSLFR